MTKPDPEEIKILVDSLAPDYYRQLRGFGYDSLTKEHVRELTEAALRGKERPGGPALFIFRWVKEGIEMGRIMDVREEPEEDNNADSRGSHLQPS